MFYSFVGLLLDAISLVDISYELNVRRASERGRKREKRRRPILSVLDAATSWAHMLHMWP